MAKSDPEARGPRGTGDVPAPSLGRIEDELMTTAQAAQFLHVTPQTLTRFVREGLVTAHRLPGARAYLFWRRDLVRVVDAHTVTPGEVEVDEPTPRKVKRAGR